jgi:hypothetical protein
MNTYHAENSKSHYPVCLSSRQEVNSLICNELFKWFPLQPHPLRCWSDPAGDFHRLTRGWGWQAALEGEEDGLSCLSVCHTIIHPHLALHTPSSYLFLLAPASWKCICGKWEDTLDCYRDHWFDALLLSCYAALLHCHFIKLNPKAFLCLLNYTRLFHIMKICVFGLPMSHSWLDCMLFNYAVSTTEVMQYFMKSRIIYGKWKG